MDKIAKPLSRKNIREFVLLIRDICGLKDSLEFPVLVFLEHILVEIFDDFVFDVVDDSELDCEALAYPDCKKILVRHTVYDGACSGNPRDLFTIDTKTRIHYVPLSDKKRGKHGKTHFKSQGKDPGS